MSELQTLLQSAAVHCRDHDCEEAIDALDEVVRLHPRIAEPHYRLGVCYSGCCRAHSLVSLGLAVAHLKHAIELSDGSGSCLALAQSLEALANAYMANCSADPPSHGKAAIEYGRKAAAMYRRQGLRFEAARVEHNLGNTWCGLPDAEFPDKWRNAVHHFEKALRVRSRRERPCDYAVTQLNRGQALLRWTLLEPLRFLDEAATCFKEASECFRLCGQQDKAEAAEIQWAKAQSLPFF